MATLSSVVVEFIANTAKYVAGLETVNSSTKKWSDNTKKQAEGAQQTFDGVSKALNKLSAQVLSAVAIQRVGAAFISAAKSASDLIDQAEKVGATAQEFSVLDIAAKKNGISIEVVKNAYRELQKSINESLLGTGEAGQAILDLGKSYTDLSNKTPTQRFYEIIDALKGIEDANERARIGNILLGKTYTELTPLILKGSSQIKEAGKQSLNAFQLQEIDRISKSFENLSIILDLQFKKAIVDLAKPIDLAISAIQFLIDNIKLIGAAIAIAFAPYAIEKWISVITTLPTIISSVPAALLPIVSVLTQIGNGIKLVFGATTIAAIGSWTKAILGAEAASAGLAIAFAKVTLAVGILFAAFEGITRLIEAGADAAGFKDYANGLKFVRESTEDWIKAKLGLETAADKENKFIQETSKRLEAARKRAEEAAEADRKLKEQMAKDAELLAFKKNLESINNLPIEQKYLRLIELVSQYNGKLDPKRQEELNKAMADMDIELEKLARGYLEAFDAGEKTARQQREIETLVRRGIISREQAQKISTSLARKEAAAYTEGLDIFVKADEIMNNSANSDQEKEYRVKSLGKSYLDLLDPIGKVGKEIGKLSALQAVKAITPEQRNALEQYYQLQLKSQQVALTGNDVMAAQQKYLETLQQINQLLPEQSDDLNVILMRTQALQNAEVQRFIAITPYFKELTDFGKNFADGLANAIVEGQNFSTALKSTFNSILKDITVLILRMTILQGIMAAIGFVSPTAGAAFGQLTGITKGALTPTGPGRAQGGPVMAGQAYRVGESGPETFVPTSNGVVLPNDFQGGGETIVVNQNINVSAGVSQTVRAEMLGLLPRFKQEAIAGVLDAKQRGGSYSKGLAAA